MPEAAGVAEACRRRCRTSGKSDKRRTALGAISTAPLVAFVPPSKEIAFANASSTAAEFACASATGRPSIVSLRVMCGWFEEMAEAVDVAVALAVAEEDVVAEADAETVAVLEEVADAETEVVPAADAEAEPTSEEVAETEASCEAAADAVAMLIVAVDDRVGAPEMLEEAVADDDAAALTEASCEAAADAVAMLIVADDDRVGAFEMLEEAVADDDAAALTVAALDSDELAEAAALKETVAEAEE